MIEENRITVPVEYDSIVNVKTRQACWKNRKLGIVNHYNEIIEPIIYDSIDVIKSGNTGGFYLVNNNKIGFFDKSWNRLSENIYTDFKMIGRDEIELINGNEKTRMKWKDFVFSQYEK